MFVENPMNLDYKTNREYRACLRSICGMNHVTEIYPSIIENSAEPAKYDDLDEETQDEMIYDSNQMKQYLNFIYKKTRDNFDFQELYELAAAKMISTDNEIGLSVLHSFDYLKHFYPCLISFFKNPRTFNDNNIAYKKILNELSYSR